MKRRLFSLLVLVVVTPFLTRGHRRSQDTRHQRRRGRWSSSFNVVQEQSIKTKGIQGRTNNSERTICHCSLNSTTCCCERRIWKTHKMGFALCKTLFPGANQSEGDFPKTLRPDDGSDYRFVIVTRNWYEALISGYLYHKSGRECWLDPWGKVKPHYKPSIGLDWVERYCSFQNFSLDPSAHGRDFCHYLQDESEEAGLRAYMDLVWARYYRPLVRFYERTIRHDSKDSNRTIHVCFEDLMNTRTREGTVKQVYEHFQISFPPGSDVSVYKKGGHATSHDPQLRSRLRNLVAQLDAEAFDNLYGKMDSLFGCVVRR